MASRISWLTLLLAGLHLAGLPTSAQVSDATAYTFTTFAGYGGGSADGVGSDAQFKSPIGVAVDSTGNIYVADSGNNTIRKITPSGVVVTIAGSILSPGAADGMGSSAQFNGPRGVAVDGVGNIYVADTFNHTIRKIMPMGTNWVVSTVAGLAGVYGSADGAGSTAEFNSPWGVAVDAVGNVYVADGNDTIRRITPLGTNWVVSTLAGLAGSSGSADGTNSAARFYAPVGITVDAGGNIYVGDEGNCTIRKITPMGTNWVVSTIAGLAGTRACADGTNSAARFFWPIPCGGGSRGQCLCCRRL
jgi:hypothetical protein